MTEIVDNKQLEDSNLTDKKIYANRQEILDRLAEVVGEATEEAKSEINYLKLLYYKLRQQETDAEMQAFLDGDGDPSTYESKPDELEPRLKELLNIQKEARTAMVKAREEEYAANLAKKKEVLEKMEAIALDTENVGQKYNDFQELQKSFKDIGAVDPQEISALWKQFTKLNEQYYDALKINKELRDYDFRKNQEAKEALCEAAERLQAVEDPVAAFRQLQEMHDQWRLIGPVAPAVREEIWTRFKAASTVINKRHSDHFEAIKAQETANEQSKTSICDKLEAIDLSQLTSTKSWEDATKVILAFQEEWKKIGAAGKKANTQLMERFRQLCDVFFKTKADFYQEIHSELKDNYKLKVALCEKAEALKESTDWRKTSDALVQLQNEWKTVGPVPHKLSQQIWERFKGACDSFFKAKEEALGGERAIERANLEKKQEVLKELAALKENIENATVQAVKDLQQKWAEIGHVPFKDKDRIQTQYKEINDFFYEKLDRKGQRARINNFRERIQKAAGEGRQNVQNERQRLQRQLERLQNDLKTYENNLGFLNAKSKGGNGMLVLMERKKEELKQEIQQVIEKIKIADENA